MRGRTHGLRATYVDGCRCDDCRQANRDYKALRKHGGRLPEVAEIDRLFEQIADIVVARELPWREYAACRNEPVDTFFPARGENHKTDRAAELCAGCSVAGPCREYAIGLPARDRHGIWGGRSVDRRRMNAEEQQLSGTLRARAS